MNRDERVARLYLDCVYGEDNIEFEPDGNIPPDFVAYEDLAIEVRRLNSHEFYGDNAIPARRHDVFLNNYLEKKLNLMAPPENGLSWHIQLSYESAPEKAEWKRDQLLIHEFLSAIETKPTSSKIKENLTDKLRITALPGTYNSKKTFLSGVVNTTRVGALLQESLRKNIEFCIIEKSKKITPYIDKYPVWTLILVNHMSPWIPDPELTWLRKNVKRCSWSEIVLLHCEDPRYYYML